MEHEFDKNKFLEDDSAGNEGAGNSGAGDDEASKKAADDAAKANEDAGGNSGAGDGSGGGDDDEQGELTWSEMQAAMNKNDDGSAGEEEEEEKKKAAGQETEEDRKKREASEAAQKAAEAEKNKTSSVPKELYSELGIDEKEDVSKLVDTIKELKKKNDELMAKTQPSKLKGQIDKLNEIVAYSDYDLMVKDFAVQYKLTEEEAKNRADILKDNGMLVIEAAKVRNGLTRFIAEKEAERQKEYADSSSMSESELKYSKDALKSHAEKTETMFGFKVAKDAEGQKKVASDQVNYITSGQMLRDITADESTLYEVGWFMKHKQVIMKALTTRGVHQTRKEILNTLQNPELGAKNNGKYVEPAKPGDFNPKKWMDI